MLARWLADTLQSTRLIRHYHFQCDCDRQRTCESSEKPVACRMPSGPSGTDSEELSEWCTRGGPPATYPQCEMKFPDAAEEPLRGERERGWKEWPVSERTADSFAGLESGKPCKRPTPSLRGPKRAIRLCVLGILIPALLISVPLYLR